MNSFKRLIRFRYSKYQRNLRRIARQRLLFSFPVNEKTISFLKSHLPHREIKPVRFKG